MNVLVDGVEVDYAGLPVEHQGTVRRYVESGMGLPGKGRCVDGGETAGDERGMPMSELVGDLIDVDESEGYSWSIDEDIRQAEESGFEVIRSTDRTLLLALDDGAAQDKYRVMLGRLQNLYELKEQSRWPSKSGVGVHVVVACKVMSFVERVALQACLGSDPMREALAIAMAAAGKENPSVLFKPGKK